MTTTITRERLATLLENEAHNAAAERIRCGEDAVTVLGKVPPVGRYNDAESDRTQAIFAEIVMGERTVTA